MASTVALIETLATGCPRGRGASCALRAGRSPPFLADVGGEARFYLRVKDAFDCREEGLPCEGWKEFRGWQAATPGL